MQALKFLLLHDIHFRAIIAGRGAQESLMLDMIRNLNLSDFVEYIGSVPYSELPNVYRRMDLFVFPTCLEESLGLVGIEAMACGVPVIGTKIGGLQDYIIDGFNGYFFSTKDIGDLVAKIEIFCNLSKSDVDKMKTNCVATAKRYDTNIVSERLYNQLELVMQ